MENCRYESYEEIIGYVQSIATETDRKRIDEEIKLFERRGWEEYVFFLVNLLIQLNLKPKEHLTLTKTSMDSYIICKAINRLDLKNSYCINYGKNKENHAEELLRDRTCYNMLFNDALRLDIKIIWPNESMFSLDFYRELNAVGNTLQNELLYSGLSYHERAIPRFAYRTDYDYEQIIISKDGVSSKDVDIVANEEKKSTDEEAAVLRKLLIIKFGFENELSFIFYS